MIAEKSQRHYECYILIRDNFNHCKIIEDMIKLVRSQIINSCTYLLGRQLYLGILYIIIFFSQLKELFDKAIRERTRRWDLKTRLGIEDISKSGFPTLNDVDIQSIHEAYQYLSKLFLEEITLATTLAKSLSLTIDDIRTNNNRRNTVHKIQYLSNKDR